MTDQKDKLVSEYSEGIANQEFWDRFGEPFFIRKKDELFEAFKAAPSADLEGLSKIKMQLNVLEGMEAHFMYFIDTGKMARITIEKEEENNGN